MTQSSRVDCFASAAATAQLLTANYAASAFQSAHRVSDFNQATISFLVSGTVTTSIEWKVECSEAKTADVWSDEMTTEVAAGVIVHREAVRGIVDDTGAPTVALQQYANVALGTHRWFRLVAKRTDGDATSALYATAIFGVV